MIVSHRYGFIFIKTARVGGTSLEMALSKFLGSEDIITPVISSDDPYREDERKTLGFRTAQNFTKPYYDLRPGEIASYCKGMIRSRIYKNPAKILLAQSKMPKRYWGHMSAEEVRERVGTHIWDNYFKFTVERNPWDKLVAAYTRKRSKGTVDESFRDFALSTGPSRSQFDRYTVDGKIGVDKVLRYERLYSDLAEISRHLSCPEDVGDVMAPLSANSGHRSSRRFRDYYDAETREMVALYFARENRLMGFSFDEGEA